MAIAGLYGALTSLYIYIYHMHYTCETHTYIHTHTHTIAGLYGTLTSFVRKYVCFVCFLYSFLPLLAEEGEAMAYAFVSVIAKVCLFCMCLLNVCFVFFL